MRVIASLAARSSSTIRTDPFDDDVEAASPRACGGKSNVGPDVPSERFADCKAHPESFAAVSLIIVHLVKLVEKVRNILVWNSNSGIGDAYGNLVLHRQLDRHASFSGVLDCVVHQIADDALKLLSIGRYCNVAIANQTQVQALLLGHGKEAPLHLPQRRGHWHH